MSLLSMVNETTTKNYKYVRGLVLEPIEGIDEYRNNNKELQARKGLLVVVNRIDLSVKRNNNKELQDVYA